MEMFTEIPPMELANILRSRLEEISREDPEFAKKVVPILFAMQICFSLNDTGSG